MWDCRSGCAVSEHQQLCPDENCCTSGSLLVTKLKYGLPSFHGAKRPCVKTASTSSIRSIVARPSTSVTVNCLPECGQVVRLKVALFNVTVDCSYVGRNVYDISKAGFLHRNKFIQLIPSPSTQMCEGELCYAENDVIKRYLDLPETRTLLGVEFPLNFSACSSTVGQSFNAHMDKWVVPTQYYVSGLLDRGIRILIYAGTYDWQCNWVANKLWVDELEWSGKESYTAQEWREWVVAGKKVGEVKRADLLTFATIRGAGHMISLFLFASLSRMTDIISCPHVPHDKPAESLAMVRRWLAGKDL